LLRLGVLAWAVYYLLFGFLHETLLVDLYESATRDVNVERTAFLIRLGGYAVFGSLLIAVNLLVDYARIRIVVEDRRSALGALVAATRFVLRNFWSVILLYLLNAAAFLALIALYALVAPGAGTGLVLMLVIGQGYILARHFLKLVGYASGISLFQRRLAHVGYTAAPAAAWPESPAVEAIVNPGPPVSA
jgi:hypothetical protein